MTDQAQSARKMVELANALGKADWPDVSIGNKVLISAAIETLRLAAQAAPGEPVAWLCEYDGHIDATTDPDTARIWRETLHRVITPLCIPVARPQAAIPPPDILAFIQQVATHAASDRQNTRSARELLKRMGEPVSEPQNAREALPYDERIEMLRLADDIAGAEIELDQQSTDVVIRALRFAGAAPPPLPRLSDETGDPK